MTRFVTRIGVVQRRVTRPQRISGTLKSQLGAIVSIVETLPKPSAGGTTSAPQTALNWETWCGRWCEV